jgi:aromatic amino acid aminotransferase I
MNETKRNETAYYFLQAPPYSPPSVRSQDAKRKNRSETDEEFLSSLVPSYLKIDYQGRVVRIDTFSSEFPPPSLPLHCPDSNSFEFVETICPGSRLGFTVCSPIIAERLEKANESSTQSASGFSQALVGKLLAEEWGLKGYIRWLKGETYSSFFSSFDYSLLMSREKCQQVSKLNTEIVGI